MSTATLNPATVVGEMALNTWLSQMYPYLNSFTRLDRRLPVAANNKLRGRSGKLFPPFR